MKKRKAFIQTVCVVLAVLMVLSISVMVIVPALGATKAELQSEISSLENERDELEERIAEIEAQIENLDFQLTSTLEKKAVLDEKNQLAQEELDVIEEQITIIETYMANRQTDLENARAQEAAQEAAWLTRLRAMEENSSLSYIQVLFQATDFSDLLTRLDLVNEVIRYDEELWASYIAARENVEVLEAEAEEMFAINEANKAELETKKAQLEADIEAACQMIEELEASLESYEQLRDEEDAAMLAVHDEIEAKQAELAAIVAAEEEEARRQAAAATGNASGGSVSVSGGGSGTLLWPSYTSLITSYYGWRVHPVYGTDRFHYGVDIGAGGGTAIWAPADGTVIAATYSSGYGNYVTIAHDNGYTTLCAHMASIAVSYGDRVSQGQVIGYVGTTGVSTGYHIHYEVHSGGSTIDPLSVSYIYA